MEICFLQRNKIQVNFRLTLIRNKIQEDTEARSFQVWNQYYYGLRIIYAIKQVSVRLNTPKTTKRGIFKYKTILKNLPFIVSRMTES